MSDYKKKINKYTGRPQLVLSPDVVTDFRDIMMDNAMGVAELDASINYQMINGFRDAYEDQNQIDLINSLNVLYDAAGKYYTPAISGGLDAYTVLMLQCDGDQDSQSFPDDSDSGHVVTAHGTFKVDTAIKRFGTGSAILSGAGAYGSIPKSSDFNLGTADFTLETWAYRDGNINDYGGIFSTSDATTNGWAAYFGNAAQANFCKFAAASGGWSDKIVSNTILPDKVQTHLEIVRHGNTLKMYQAGLEVASADVTGLDFADGPNNPNIGRLFVTTDNYYYKGRLDAIRISKGIARHTAPFTPPEYPYSDTKHNMTLISKGFSVPSVPSAARMLYKVEYVSAVELDTDLMFDLSRDDDGQRIQGTPELVRTIGSNKLIGVDFNLSGLPSGTDMVYRIRSENTSDLYAKALACQIKT